MTSKMKTKQLRWLAATLMLVAAMVVPSVAWAQNTITPSKPDGEGTAASPYQIGSAAELYWFAALVNGDTNVDGVAAADKAACAELTQNITVNSGVLKSDGSLADDASGFTAWTPISTDDENPYTGTFDGKGYTISGLYFNDTSKYYIGLFGFVGSGSKICNVGIVDSYFNGGSCIGGVCGYCTSGEITNCYNTGTVIGTGSNIGGVCGYSSGTITDCYNTGNVSGTSTSDQEGFVGGVCGLNSGYPNKSTITRSYNSGKVSGGYYVGGVCGVNGFGYPAQTINCYNTGEVTGTYDVGGICGFNDSYIEKCYNSAAVSGDSYVGSVCGFNRSVITTCYYLSGTAAGGINNSDDVSGSAESKTAEQFASGEVAWLLNQSTSDGSLAWYQDLSAEGGDPSPVLKGKKVYYGYEHGSTEEKYTNSPHTHAYDSSATDEESGNHDKSYKGVFTWADSDDKTNAMVTATFTCAVCGKVVTPDMNAVFDQEHSNATASCTEKAQNTYTTSYSFSGATFTDTYVQVITPALGHNMNEITFNEGEKIYSNQCQREGCDHIGYYATSDGMVEATYEDGVYKVPFLCLNDGLAYDSKAKYTVESLEYKRMYSHDKWVAVYVPFAIDCNQLPDFMEMAVINNFHEYEQTDGSYNVVLEVKRKTSGTIPALTPCVMRLKEAPIEGFETLTMPFSNAVFSPAADKYIDCSSVERYYKFTGSLAGIEEYIFNEETDFVLNQGTLYKAKGETSLKAQRWYLSATDRAGSSNASIASLRSIAIQVVGESDVTGIEDIHVITERAASMREGIFDLQGRRLNSEPAQGIYIKNGTKMIK